MMNNLYLGFDAINTPNGIPAAFTGVDTLLGSRRQRPTISPTSSTAPGHTR